MAMKLVILALAFMLVVTTRVSSLIEAQKDPYPADSPIYLSDSPNLAPVYLSDFPMMAPEYLSDSPMMAPEYFSDSPMMSPVYTVEPPMMTPDYSSDSPMVAPVNPPALPIPRPHIPKHCAVGCVEYCKTVKEYSTKKRTCQRICSYCCQQCDCIPTPGKPKSCGTWDKVTSPHGQYICP